MSEARKAGFIFADWASVKISLSIRSLNQKITPRGIWRFL